MKPPASLWRNSRFYILVAGMVFAAAIWLVQMGRGADDLAAVRISEIYGITAIAVLGSVLLITPVLKLWPGMPVALASQLKHARRALGVAAFGYAALHAAIGFWGQLGGFAGLGFLPGSFLAGVVLGAAALLILFLLAALSFDAAIRKLGFPRWKRIQRLVYLAAGLVVVHMLMIGSHFSHRIEALGTVVLFGIAVVAVAEVARIAVDYRRSHGRSA